MDIDLSEQELMLRKTARDFLTSNCPKALVRQMMTDDKGYTLDLWQKIASLGWLGLVIPEEYGGSGSSFLDLAILLEETGRALLPAPLFSTVLFGAVPILQWGNDEQKNYFLPQIANGNLTLTLALFEDNTKYEPARINCNAIKDKGCYILSGKKLFVPNAHVAHWILCAMHTKVGNKEGITIFLVDAKSKGITCRVLNTINGEKQCEVSLENVSVPEKYILGASNGGVQILQKTLQLATLAKCAEMLGCVDQVLEMTIDYAKQRHQFGHPIGSFQAIQHYCANMLIDVDAIRLLTYQAAWKISQELPCTKEVAMAKARASDGYKRIALLGLKIHGGVGYMEDHDMSLYIRQAQMAESAFGDADFHRENIARELAS